MAKLKIKIFRRKQELILKKTINLPKRYKPGALQAIAKEISQNLLNCKFAEKVPAIRERRVQFLAASEATYDLITISRSVVALEKRRLFLDVGLKKIGDIAERIEDRNRNKKEWEAYINKYIENNLLDRITAPSAGPTLETTSDLVAPVTPVNINESVEYPRTRRTAAIARNNVSIGVPRAVGDILVSSAVEDAVVGSPTAVPIQGWVDRSPTEIPIQDIAPKTPPSIPTEDMAAQLPTATVAPMEVEAETPTVAPMQVEADTPAVIRMQDIAAGSATAVPVQDIGAATTSTVPAAKVLIPSATHTLLPSTEVDDVAAQPTGTVPTEHLSVIPEGPLGISDLRRDAGAISNIDLFITAPSGLIDKSVPLTNVTTAGATTAPLATSTPMPRPRRGIRLQTDADPSQVHPPLPNGDDISLESVVPVQAPRRQRRSRGLIIDKRIKIPDYAFRAMLQNDSVADTTNTLQKSSSAALILDNMFKCDHYFKNPGRLVNRLANLFGVNTNSYAPTRPVRSVGEAILQEHRRHAITASVAVPVMSTPFVTAASAFPGEVSSAIHPDTISEAEVRVQLGVQGRRDRLVSAISDVVDIEAPNGTVPPAPDITEPVHAVSAVGPAVDASITLNIPPPIDDCLVQSATTAIKLLHINVPETGQAQEVRESLTSEEQGARRNLRSSSRAAHIAAADPTTTEMAPPAVIVTASPSAGLPVPPEPEGVQQINMAILTASTHAGMGLTAATAAATEAVQQSGMTTGAATSGMGLPVTTVATATEAAQQIGMSTGTLTTSIPAGIGLPVTIAATAQQIGMVLPAGPAVTVPTESLPPVGLALPAPPARMVPITELVTPVAMDQETAIPVATEMLPVILPATPARIQPNEIALPDVTLLSAIELPKATAPAASSAGTVLPAVIAPPRVDSPSAGLAPTTRASVVGRATVGSERFSPSPAESDRRRRMVEAVFDRKYDEFLACNSQYPATPRELKRIVNYQEIKKDKYKVQPDLREHWNDKNFVLARLKDVWSENDQPSLEDILGEENCKQNMCPLIGSLLKLNAEKRVTITRDEEGVLFGAMPWTVYVI